MSLKNSYKHGKKKQKMSWTKAFKIAIIEENIQEIGKLITVLPSFNSVDEMQEVASLIQEAVLIVEKERKEVLNTMQSIKKTQQFLLAGSSFTTNNIIDSVE